MNMKDQGKLALIVAGPGRWRDAAEALLKSLRPIAWVEHAEDEQSALKVFTEHLPALVLLDAGLPNGQAWSFLRRMKAKWPEPRCIVLVATAEQRSIALEAGADGSLLKGFSAAQLSTIVGEQLPGLVVGDELREINGNVLEENKAFLDETK